MTRVFFFSLLLTLCVFVVFFLRLKCGVPKKGHVCPYQPKLTRRPGEPLPEMRSAAIQVEMDEVSGGKKKRGFLFFKDFPV
jgi:hypothetical protein